MPVDSDQNAGLEKTENQQQISQTLLERRAVTVDPVFQERNIRENSDA